MQDCGRRSSFLELIWNKRLKIVRLETMCKVTTMRTRLSHNTVIRKKYPFTIFEGPFTMFDLGGGVFPQQ